MSLRFGNENPYLLNGKALSQQDAPYPNAGCRARIGSSVACCFTQTLRETETGKSKNKTKVGSSLSSSLTTAVHHFLQIQKRTRKTTISESENHFRHCFLKLYARFFKLSRQTLKSSQLLMVLLLTWPSMLFPRDGFLLVDQDRSSFTFFRRP